MRILAIDPGVAPALAMRTAKSMSVRTIEDCPQMPHSLRSAMIEFKPTLVVIEQVGVMPGQGVSSSGRFMEAFGLCKGVAIGLGIPLITVLPSTWKRALLSGYDLGDNAAPKDRKKIQKRAAAAYVRDHFPATNLYRPGCSTVDIDLADVVCIAAWAESEK